MNNTSLESTSVALVWFAPKSHGFQNYLRTDRGGMSWAGCQCCFEKRWF